MDFVYGIPRTLTRFVRNLAGRITGRPSWYGESVTEEVKYTFYNTIEEFGYHFNEKGELVDKDGGGFKFFVKENDRNYNQQHYDALGDLITEYLYNKMETDLQLHKVFVPVDAEKIEPQGFIFRSRDAMESQKLMVIVNGAGVVRAGQWSRKLIINEGIDIGSQFPYIRRARDAGYGVILLNTNQNQQVINGKTMDIRGSATAEDHGMYVWEHIVSKTKASDVVIVAHSYGGIVTCTMAEKFLADFKKRVFCIVFTDSVHTVGRDQWSQPVKDFLKERAVNFASTYVPLDYMMQASNPDDCLAVSAGTEEHERTSHACIDSAFHFILSNHASWSTQGTMAQRHFKPLPDDLSQFSCANRWSRMLEKEKEGEAGTSKMAEKPSPSSAKKRSATELEDDSVSKNGGKGQEEEEKTDPLSKNGGRGQKEEEKTDPLSKNGGRGQKEEEKTDPLSKNGGRGQKEEEKTDSKTAEEELETPDRGPELAVNSSDKADKEEGQDLSPAVSRTKDMEDTHDQNQGDTAVMQVADTANIQAEEAENETRETETEFKEQKAEEAGLETKDMEDTHDQNQGDTAVMQVADTANIQAEKVENETRETETEVKEQKAEEAGSETKEDADREGAKEGSHKGQE